MKRGSLGAMDSLWWEFAKRFEEFGVGETSLIEKPPFGNKITCLAALRGTRLPRSARIFRSPDSRRFVFAHLGAAPTRMRPRLVLMRL